MIYRDLITVVCRACARMVDKEIMLLVPAAIQSLVRIREILCFV